MLKSKGQLNRLYREKEQLDQYLQIKKSKIWKLVNKLLQDDISLVTSKNIDGVIVPGRLLSKNLTKEQTDRYAGYANGLIDFANKINGATQDRLNARIQAINEMEESYGEKA